jgi:hypothetical protein
MLATVRAATNASTLMEFSRQDCILTATELWLAKTAINASAKSASSTTMSRRSECQQVYTKPERSWWPSLGSQRSS